MIKDYKSLIGDTYKTNEGYLVKIIDYVDTKNVLVKFVDRPDVQIWSSLQNIKNGQIKNPYHKSVYNKGFYGIGNYTARRNNIKTEEYVKWFSMFDVMMKNVTKDNQHISDVRCQKNFVISRILLIGIIIINILASIH